MPRGKERAQKTGETILWRGRLAEMFCTRRETPVVVSKERLGPRAVRTLVIESTWFRSLTDFTRNVRGHSEEWLTSLERSPSMY